MDSLHHDRGAGETLSGKRVFITGASGFIGRALAERYRGAGALVSGLDFHADPDADVIGGDLTRPDDWAQALAGTDTVVHTAAIVSNTAPMDAAWRVNVQATADLLQRCVAAGVGHFIQLSSVAAYGFRFTREARESDPLRPMGNTYVDTKIASEHRVLACHGAGEMACTIVRPGDVYGPGSRPWVILPLQMLRIGRFLLPAHGQGLFSPVYIDDLVQGIYLCSMNPAAHGQIFNISGGITPTCSEFFGYHARMAGVAPPRVTSTPVALALAGAVGGLARALGRDSELGRGTMDMLSRRAGYSIERARQGLGYAPRVSLDEGMRRTHEWAIEAGLVPPNVADS